ncbi:MAG: hypothetical protein KJ077_35635 [Anaerolineae bacterium]|nr:hypothetical protein [Anaerolineae bacterium]
MPAFYYIDPQLRIVFSSLEGVVTDEEALNHEERLCYDPHFEPDFSQLIDCRRVTEVRATNDFIRFIAVRSPFSSKAHRAIVAGTDLVYGLARMYQMLRADEEQIRVFRDMEEARRWLGIE